MQHKYCPFGQNRVKGPWFHQLTILVDCIPPPLLWLRFFLLLFILILSKSFTYELTSLFLFPSLLLAKATADSLLLYFLLPTFKLLRMECRDLFIRNWPSLLPVICFICRISNGQVFFFLPLRCFVYCKKKCNGPKLDKFWSNKYLAKLTYELSGE